MKLFVDGIDDENDPSLDQTEIATEGEVNSMLAHAVRRWELEAAVWVTKDGQRIPIARMSDMHLQNTVRYLRRQARKRYGITPTLHRLADKPMSWGDRFRAVWMALRSVGGRRPAVLFYQFPLLHAELERRGLPELEDPFQS